MYKSPIELKIKDIVSDVVKQVDEYTLRCFQQIGVNVDKYELIKALEYDRGQYEKGWHDRDNEIVRCKDCKFNYANQIPSENCCQLCVELPINDEFYCAYGEREENE